MDADTIKQRLKERETRWAQYEAQREMRKVQYEAQRKLREAQYEAESEARRAQCKKIIEDGLIKVFGKGCLKTDANSAETTPQIEEAQLSTSVSKDAQEDNVNEGRNNYYESLHKEDQGETAADNKSVDDPLSGANVSPQAEENDKKFSTTGGKRQPCCFYCFLPHKSHLCAAKFRHNHGHQRAKNCQSGDDNVQGRPMHSGQCEQLMDKFDNFAQSITKRMDEMCNRMDQFEQKLDRVCHKVCPDLMKNGANSQHQNQHQTSAPIHSDHSSRSVSGDEVKVGIVDYAHCNVPNSDYHEKLPEFGQSDTPVKVKSISNQGVMKVKSDLGSPLKYTGEDSIEVELPELGQNEMVGYGKKWKEGKKRGVRMKEPNKNLSDVGKVEPSGDGLKGRTSVTKLGVTDAKIWVKIKKRKKRKNLV